MAVTGPKLPHERQRCDRSGAAPNQALLTVRGAAVAPRAAVHSVGTDLAAGARAAPIAGIATASGANRRETDDRAAPIAGIATTSGANRRETDARAAPIAGIATTIAGIATTSGANRRETDARAAPIAGIATTSGGGRDPALGPATVGTVLALMVGPGCGPLRIPLNSVRTRRRSMPLKNTSGSSI